MDGADEAQRTEALELEAALARAGRRPPGAQRRDSAGQVVCVDCGEPVPSERLAFVPDAVRCVACQAELEEVAW